VKNFIHHDFPVLERVDLPEGRVYKTPSGKNYPSVTQVTGYLTKQAILEWRKRVGEEEANRVSTQASSRGTRIHSLCEEFLKGEFVAPSLPDYEMWKDMMPIVDKIDNIHALESKLYSDKLELAGTVDCIGEFDGVLSVIDFKTSKRPKDINNIQHYFLQATAYSVMFEELTGIKVPNLTILIGVDHDQPQVFQGKRSSFIHNLVDLRQTYKKLNLL
jgi:ATP-dependent exoDNAse (exonuclease V) beta subunit